MKKICLLICLGLIFMFLWPVTVQAGWVEGYWKKDGTYVPGYWRSNPNGLKYDNYSFDGDWSDAFNDSYYSSDRNYSSDWYTPTWTTQDDYSVGKYFYDSRQSYKDYSYDSFDYDYDFRKDPIYDYSPSYDYGYESPDLYEPYSEPEPSYDYGPNYDYDYGSDYDYTPDYGYDSGYDYEYDW